MLNYVQSINSPLQIDFKNTTSEGKTFSHLGSFSVQLNPDREKVLILSRNKLSRGSSVKSYARRNEKQGKSNMTQFPGTPKRTYKSLNILISPAQSPSLATTTNFKVSFTHLNLTDKEKLSLENHTMSPTLDDIDKTMLRKNELSEQRNVTNLDVADMRLSDDNSDFFSLTKTITNNTSVQKNDVLCTFNTKKENCFWKNKVEQKKLKSNISDKYDPYNFIDESEESIFLPKKRIKHSFDIKETLRQWSSEGNKSFISQKARILNKSPLRHTSKITQEKRDQGVECIRDTMLNLTSNQLLEGDETTLNDDDTTISNQAFAFEKFINYNHEMTNEKLPCSSVVNYTSLEQKQQSFCADDENMLKVSNNELCRENIQKLTNQTSAACKNKLRTDKMNTGSMQTKDENLSNNVISTSAHNSKHAKCIENKITGESKTLQETVTVNKQKEQVICNVAETVFNISSDGLNKVEQKLTQQSPSVPKKKRCDETKQKTIKKYTDLKQTKGENLSNNADISISVQSCKYEECTGSNITDKSENLQSRTGVNDTLFEHKEQSIRADNEKLIKVDGQNLTHQSPSSLKKNWYDEKKQRTNEENTASELTKSQNTSNNVDYLISTQGCKDGEFTQNKMIDKSEREVVVNDTIKNQNESNNVDSSISTHGCKDEEYIKNKVREEKENSPGRVELNDTLFEQKETLLCVDNEEIMPKLSTNELNKVEGQDLTNQPSSASKNEKCGIKQRSTNKKNTSLMKTKDEHLFNNTNISIPTQVCKYEEYTDNKITDECEKLQGGVAVNHTLFEQKETPIFVDNEENVLKVSTREVNQVGGQELINQPLSAHKDRQCNEKKRRTSKKNESLRQTKDGNLSNVDISTATQVSKYEKCTEKCKTENSPGRAAGNDMILQENQQSKYVNDEETITKVLTTELNKPEGQKLTNQSRSSCKNKQYIEKKRRTNKKSTASKQTKDENLSNNIENSTSIQVCKHEECTGDKVTNEKENASGRIKNDTLYDQEQQTICNDMSILWDSERVEIERQELPHQSPPASKNKHYDDNKLRTNKRNTASKLIKHGNASYNVGFPFLIRENKYNKFAETETSPSRTVVNNRSFEQKEQSIWEDSAENMPMVAGNGLNKVEEQNLTNQSISDCENKQYTEKKRKFYNRKITSKVKKDKNAEIDSIAGRLKLDKQKVKTLRKYTKAKKIGGTMADTVDIKEEKSSENRDLNRIIRSEEKGQRNFSIKSKLLIHKMKKEQEKILHEVLDSMPKFYSGLRQFLLTSKARRRDGWNESITHSIVKTYDTLLDSLKKSNEQHQTNVASSFKKSIDRFIKQCNGYFEKSAQNMKNIFEQR